ncbi:low molecular weight phosphotyrosine protein phosphatase [Flavobacteriaceae bacterium]|jgi:protein-tyrosine phosphatase|nr:low molecular weight phosphotyrosine protein phosphatase [Flavobacteriaceae bacterium]
MKILMVCLGNICRSPLAEGLLKSKLPPDHFVVDSAGTSNYHIGQLPDSRSIQIAKSHNINISNQRGRQFKIRDFDIYDFIYVMDNSNFQCLSGQARTNYDKKKIKLILAEIENMPLRDVPDPYYGGADGFLRVFQMLDVACEKIAEKLMSNNT